MSENKVKDAIKLLSQRYKLALFSNPCGVGWVGKFQGFDGQTAKLLGARRIEFGLFKGSHDQVGWLSMVVTEAMVGKRIAVPVGLEAKDKHGRPSPEQIKFNDRLINDGGIGGIVRSGEEAEQVIISWMERNGGDMSSIAQTLAPRKHR